MKTTRKKLFDLGVIFFGCALYALTVCMFLIPNGLITGGSTGIALCIHRLTGLPVSLFTACFNAVMFAAGYVVLGKTFVLNTALATVIYPFFLSIFERIPALAIRTDNPMLATIYAGLGVGVGVGLVIRVGASTGGMDIPPLILKKKFGLNVSATMYAFDFVILLAQAVSTDLQSILYGILLVIIYTLVLDKVLLLGMGRLQLEIVSEHCDEINRALTDRLDCGTTLIKARTGYLGRDCMMIMSVISPRDLPRVSDQIMAIDPEAFVIVDKAHEVRGRGYTLERVHTTRDAGSAKP